MNLHAKSKFSHNFLATGLTFGAHILLGMWYVRMLVLRLGPEQYGIVPLVVSLMGYLAITTIALNTSIGRHMTACLAHGDLDRASRIGGTALTGILLLALPVMVAGVLAYCFLPDLIRIPTGTEADARLFFAFCLGGFLLTQISIPFGTATFCTNRLDWRAWVDLLVYVIRTVGAFALLALFGNRLWLVGLAIAVAAGVQLGVQYRLWRRLLPGIACRAGIFDAGVFKDVFSTGSWITVNAAGALLFLSTDLIIINRMLGPREAGMYAPVLVLSQVTRAIAGSLGNLFTPKITRLFAEKDLGGLQSYVVQSTRFLGILMGIPIGLLCALSEDFLALWMGPLFASRWPLVWLLVGHLCVNLSVYPQQAVQTAANRVKIPALVTLGMGLFHIGFAILLAGPLGLGSLGVALSGALVLTAKNAVFTPAYNMRILDISARRAYAGMQGSLLTAAATIGITAGVHALLPFTGWIRFAAAGALGALFALAATFAFLLSPREKGEIRRLVRKIVRQGLGPDPLPEGMA